MSNTILIDTEHSQSQTLFNILTVHLQWINFALKQKKDENNDRNITFSFPFLLLSLLCLFFYCGLKLVHRNLLRLDLLSEQALHSLTSPKYPLVCEEC